MILFTKNVHAICSHTKYNLCSSFSLKIIKKILEYAMRLQDLVNGNPSFLQKLIWSDEIHFHLNSLVNKQTCFLVVLLNALYGVR